MPESVSVLLNTEMRRVGRTPTQVLSLFSVEYKTIWLKGNLFWRARGDIEAKLAKKNLATDAEKLSWLLLHATEESNCRTAAAFIIVIADLKKIILSPPLPASTRRDSVVVAAPAAAAAVLPSPDIMLRAFFNPETAALDHLKVVQDSRGFIVAFHQWKRMACESLKKEVERAVVSAISMIDDPAETDMHQLAAACFLLKANNNVDALGRACIKAQRVLAAFMQQEKWSDAEKMAQIMKMIWPDVCFYQDEHYIFFAVVAFFKEKLAQEVDEVFMFSDDIHAVVQVFDARHQSICEYFRRVFSVFMVPGHSQLKSIQNTFLQLSGSVVRGIGITHTLKTMAASVIEGRPIDALLIKSFFGAVNYGDYVWIGGECARDDLCARLRLKSRESSVFSALEKVIKKSILSVEAAKGARLVPLSREDFHCVVDAILRVDDVIRSVRDALHDLWHYSPIQKAIIINADGTLTFLDAAKVSDPATNTIKFNKVKEFYFYQQELEKIRLFQYPFSEKRNAVLSDVSEKTNHVNAAEIMCFSTIQAGFDGLIALLQSTHDALGTEQGKTFDKLVLAARQKMRAANAAFEMRVLPMLNLDSVAEAQPAAAYRAPR